MIPEFLIWLMLAAIVVVLLLRGMRLPMPYRNGGCMGRIWRQAYPSASKETIRTFLDCLIEGMGFPERDRLKFAPTDRVIDIYRSIYGGRTPFGDAMECETFAQELSERFKRPLRSLLEIWEEDVTLGRLFEFIIAQPGD